MGAAVRVEVVAPVGIVPPQRFPLQQALPSQLLLAAVALLLVQHKETMVPHRHLAQSQLLAVVVVDTEEEP